MQTTGKGYNHAVVVDDKNVNLIKELAKARDQNTLKDNSDYNNTLDDAIKRRNVGVTYDINSIKQFLKDNKNKMATYLTSADKAADRKLSFYGKLNINDKAITSIRSETGGGLVLRNNIVTVGSSKYFINGGIVKSSGSFPNSAEPGWVAGIHDHPFGKTLITVVNWNAGTVRSSWTFYAGPSPEQGNSGDKAPGNAPREGYRNALIDDANIYLYDNTHPDITIHYK